MSDALVMPDERSRGSRPFSSKHASVPDLEKLLLSLQMTKRMNLDRAVIASREENMRRSISKCDGIYIIFMSTGLHNRQYNGKDDKVSNGHNELIEGQVIDHDSVEICAKGW